MFAADVGISLPETYFVFVFVFGGFGTAMVTFVAVPLLSFNFAASTTLA